MSIQRLVARRVRVRRGGKTDAGVTGVEDGVIAFKESVPVDKVETLAGRRANVVDDQVDVT